MIRRTTIAALIATATLGLMACEKQGPAEKVGEEVDEAVNTIKNDGHETTGDKLDDAADHARESINEAADAIKDKAQ